MKTHFLKIIALVATAATVILSCDKQKTGKNLTVSISADEQFAEDNTAEVTLSMSDASTKAVIVSLTTVGSALPGTTVLPYANITVPATATIAAGSTSARIPVTLNPAGLAAGTYSIGIQILSASGAQVSKDKSLVYVKAVTNGYGGEGDSPGGEGSYSGWSVSYKGFIPFTYEDMSGNTVTEDSEVFEIKGTGSEYYYSAVLDGGFYTEHVKDASQTDIASIVTQWIQEDLEYYSAYYDDLTAGDMISQGDDTLGSAEFTNGDYEFFIFGTDVNGNYNGKFAWCALTKTGSSVTDDPDPDTPELDVQLSLQSNWSVTVKGEPYWYDGDAYFDVNVNAPGIKYFWMETNTDEELAYYYGSVEGLLADYQNSLMGKLADDPTATMADLIFSSADSEYYTSYWGPGATKLYLMEFDQDGKATGRYGVSNITLPNLDGWEDEAASSAPSYRIKFLHKAKSITPTLPIRRIGHLRK